MAQVERRYESEPTSKRSLTNDDFRKILMTPRRGDETPSRYAHLDPNQKFSTPEKKDSDKDRKKRDTKKKKKRMMLFLVNIEIVLLKEEMV